jgi:hypothetical protein
VELIESLLPNQYLELDTATTKTTFDKMIIEKGYEGRGFYGMTDADLGITKKEKLHFILKPQKISAVFL